MRGEDDINSLGTSGNGYMPSDGVRFPGPATIFCRVAKW
ncbi:hypothetical protein BSTP3_271 [Bacillus phage BSTP3]|nr:hypothetical protein BSTP3_271 [Bacillus phage BSTP3]